MKEVLSILSICVQNIRSEVRQQLDVWNQIAYNYGAGILNADSIHVTHSSNQSKTEFGFTMNMFRRDFIKMAPFSVAAVADTLFADDSSLPRTLFEPGDYHRIDSEKRRFHICTNCDVLDSDVDYPLLWKESGITDVWVCLWFYGFFPYPWDKIDLYLERLKTVGLTPHFTAVPFCHNGGSLLPTDPNSFPNLPPNYWKKAKRFDGSENWGFSWHAPVDDELRDSTELILKKYGSFDYFLDDDFRFANSPADIGGCICDDCRRDFLQKSAFPASRWDELLDDWRENRDTPLLRSWVDYTCDKLTYCFKKTVQALPEVDLGIMVMFMGSERAGIRLEDYKGHLFRVGEMMFNDPWFEQARNKARELFSSLFHRRFCSPGRAFSETTGYPIKQLSPRNMAAKLTVSTLSDVRNTMFMSGLPVIPASYWSTLAPRMKKEADIHNQITGRKPTGPFKHYWGLADRYMRGDEANCLFLLTGVPFEVCDRLPADGWTFLGDASADEMDRGVLVSPGTVCLARGASGSGRYKKLDESFEALFDFRRSLLDRFREKGIPYIEEEIPFVLSRYESNDNSPDLLVLWNVNEDEKTVHLRVGNNVKIVTVAPLDSELVSMV